MGEFSRVRPGSRALFLYARCRSVSHLKAPKRPARQEPSCDARPVDERPPDTLRGAELVAAGFHPPDVGALKASRLHGESVERFGSRVSVTNLILSRYAFCRHAAEQYFRYRPAARGFHGDGERRKSGGWRPHM
jgi:hypothetical protein